MPDYPLETLAVIMAANCVRHTCIETFHAKGKLGDGGPVAEFVARGEAELAIQQLCEHMLVPGVDIVGPLPPELQQITVFSAGIATVSKEPEAGKALISFLASPAARAEIGAGHSEGDRGGNALCRARAAGIRRPMK